MIRLLGLALVVFAIWRLFGRRAASGPVVTVAGADGSSRTLAPTDPLAAELVEITDRVAP
ncbi:MAG: hypothetical protein U0R50_08470 [Gaiellales bacterium]